MTLLLVAATAHAACALVQTPTEAGARIQLEAQAEPLSCRAVYLRTDGSPPKVRAWVDGRRVPRRQVFPLDDDLVVALPELSVGSRAVLEVAVGGGNLVVGLGAPPPRPVAQETHSTWTFALDARHPAWSFADASLGAVEVSEATLGPDGRRTRALSPAPAQGHLRLPPGSLTLVAPGTNVVGLGGDGVDVARTADGLRFDAPEGGEARWRVSSAGGEPVIPDLRTFVDGLEWRFRQVSLPEPALPAGFALATDLYQRVLDIHALVGSRMHEGVIPGADPLRPRALNRAWRSGWGSSVERGLVLMRLLQQQQVPVTWLVTGARAEPFTLTGYDTMILAVAAEGGDLLLDPSCRLCAPGEVSTTLAGRAAVGGAEVVPLAPGRLERSISLSGSEFNVRVNATGAAALWLREVADGLAGHARDEALVGALGVVAGAVASASGLDRPGEPVNLELRTSRSVRPPFDGDPPWAGGWADL